MKLEDQCCTKEQAERLKKLGVIQKSLFYYHPAFQRPTFGETWVTKWGTQYKKTLVCNDKNASASSFTLAELGLMLPGMIGDTKLVQWHIASNDSRWALSYGVQYRYKDNDPVHYGTFPLHCVFGSTEAKARAELLICLLTDGKVTAEEINKRLTDK